MNQEKVRRPGMKPVAQGQASVRAATEDLLGNFEKNGGDDGGFGVPERQTESSNNEISLYDKDLRNICSWLGEYDAKILWIESEDDRITESMEHKEVPFENGTSHIEENRTYSNNDTSVQTKQENFWCQEAHLEAIMEHSRENVGINKYDATEDIPDVGLDRVNDTESIVNEKEVELDNVVEKGKEKQLEEEELEVLEGDNEEEYYLIEEIIEEGSEEVEADIGESGREQTGENLKEDEEYQKVVNKKYKEKEYEVFVGGLHRYASREDIYEVFSQVGEIKSIRMTIDPWSKKNRGYAFVQYRTVEQARCALRELKNPLVYGKQCQVIASRGNDTLFVGNIRRTWSQERFEDKLKSLGVVNYKEVRLIQDKRNQGMTKGFAFLEFWSHAEATEAYDRLRNGHVVFGADRAAKVSFAMFVKSDLEILPFEAKTVFINGVPPTWDEDQIRSCLKKYGFIESVKLARDMISAKRFDFGYVTFDTHSSASRCIDGINASGLGKGQDKVVTDITADPLGWQRPLPDLAGFQVKVEAQYCRPRKTRDKWDAKGNRHMHSRSISAHDLHFSPSPPEVDRISAHVTNHVVKTNVSLTRDCRLKRPLELSDRDLTFPVSKKPRHVVSFHRSHREMLQDQKFCAKRNTREPEGAEYDSHVMMQRHSSWKNDYHLNSCEHIYSNRNSHSYNEYFGGRARDLPEHERECCHCELSKRMDYSPDMYEDLRFHRTKPRFDYDARSSRRIPSTVSSSENRHERSNGAYGNGCDVSFRDKMYRVSDDLSYYKEYDRSGDFHGPYMSSSSPDRKYIYQRSNGVGSSNLSFNEHSRCCNCISQRCRDSFRRERATETSKFQQ